MQETILLRRDRAGNPIPTGTDFVTEEVTLSGTSYNEIAVKGVEAMIKSEEDFVLGESATATGFSVNSISVGTARKEKIWIKGSDSQIINILWVK